MTHVLAVVAVLIQLAAVTAGSGEPALDASPGGTAHKFVRAANPAVATHSNGVFLPMHNAAAALAADAAVPATGPAAGHRPWRIMPVGDSITEGGKAFSNYRYPLLRKLKEAGYHVEFVGSRRSDSPDGPLAHEGYGGKNAEFLATVAPKSFREHPADVVLIHAGHNHTAEEQPVEKIVAATESMIGSFRQSNPDVVVLLAQVIPSGKLPKYSYLPALNEQLAKLAKRLDTPRQRVILVNQSEGFDPAKDTIDDKVHPNAQGAAKMADRWFEALDKVLPGKEK